MQREAAGRGKDGLPEEANRDNCQKRQREIAVRGKERLPEEANRDNCRKRQRETARNGKLKLLLENTGRCELSSK